jgi:hypothetical protein
MKRLLAIALCVFAAGCGSDRSRTARQACDQKPTRTPAKHAVLVNADTERRHRDNIVRAFETLRALGFPQESIHVFSPADRGRLPKTALRLAPVPDDFWRVMDDLTAVAAPGDLLVIYGTGHGDTDQGDSLLELRRGEIWPADLREEIDHCRANTVVVMDQCYSGGFVDVFQGTMSRVIAISSTAHDHLTDCGEFARTFWDSFLHPERADRNADGKTSVREAYQAAHEAHKKALEGDLEVHSDGACRSFNGFDDALLN